MQNFKFLFVLAFFFTALNLSAATCNSLGNGAWDDPLNWSCGAVPAPGDVINIMPGHTVTVSNNTNLTGAPVVINIYGVLLFDSPGAKLRLECGSSVVVFPGGSIQDSGNGTPSHSIRICGVDEWQGSDGTVLGPVVIGVGVLPVDVTAFEVFSNGYNISISWITVSERDNAFFSVQRSNNGLSWETIETIEGAGNSTQEINYEVNDSPAVSGTYYYRLTQTDYDGSRETFEAKSVYFEKSYSEIELDVYPNPYQSGQLNLRTNAVESYTVMIQSISGQLMYSGNFDASQISIAPAELSRGIYVVNIKSTSGQIATKKLVVQ